MVVSAALLAIILLQIRPIELRDRITDGEPVWFCLATALVAVALLVGAFRWHVLLDAAGLRSSLRRTIEAYFAGALASNALPTQFGGDLVRGLIVGGAGTRTRALATVLVDRVTLLACLTLLAWGVYVVAPDPVPGAVVATLAVATAAGIAAAALTATCLILRRPRPLFRRAAVKDAGRTIRACIAPRPLWTTTALGLTYQALILLGLWLLARSIDLDVAFAVLAVATPSVLLLAALPISIGGLGVREASYVVLLSAAGADAEASVLLSLATAAAFAFASAPGLWPLLRRR